MREIKYFNCHFQVEKIHKADDDITIGKFEGYASTFGNIDRDNDIIVTGAFTDTLEDHKNRSRQIRMLYQHGFGKLIGGFPFEGAHEDDLGLFVKGDINLETQTGREAFALMNQGVLEDMSIGFFIIDSERRQDGIRLIQKVELFEISLVSEPANQLAQVTAIKCAIPFHNLDIAAASQSSQNESDLHMLTQFTGSEQTPTDAFKSAFLWCDKANVDKHDAYSLQIGEIIDGKLMASPRKIFAAAVDLQCGKTIHPDSQSVVIKTLERYYQKMGRESPFKKGFSPDEIKSLGRGDLVAFLRSGPVLSKNGAEYIASKINGGSGNQAADTQADGLQRLKQTLSKMKGDHHA